MSPSLSAHPDMIMLWCERKKKKLSVDKSQELFAIPLKIFVLLMLSLSLKKKKNRRKARAPSPFDVGFFFLVAVKQTEIDIILHVTFLPSLTVVICFPRWKKVSIHRGLNCYGIWCLDLPLSALINFRHCAMFSRHSLYSDLFIYPDSSFHDITVF